MKSIGLVLHPARDSAAAVAAVLDWAARKRAEVLGIDAEIERLNCAAVAVVVATPAGSTAYSFSAGGPIVSPAVDALLVTPAAPHSAYNRGLVVSVHDSLTLEILPDSGRLAVEVDGPVAAHVDVGDRIELQPRPGAAHVVRLGRTTFYERARRKLRLTDSAE